jgi:hypothetical protein
MIQQGEQWVGGFRAGEKSQTDAKWLPTDWQELRETFSVPPGWSAIANDLNLRANMVQREVQNNIDGIQVILSWQPHPRSQVLESFPFVNLRQTPRGALLV